MMILKFIWIIKEVNKIYDRNIKFGTLLIDAHLKTLDRYVRQTMKIKDEYELVQDIPRPYIFIRVKGSLKKINTELTMEDLQLSTINDSINNIAFTNIIEPKSGEYVQYDGDLDKYVHELKSCNVLTKEQSILINLYDIIQTSNEILDTRNGYSAH